MFVALELAHRQHSGFAGRLLDRLRPSKLTCELKEVLGGHYLHMRWAGASHPDWSELEEACFRHHERVLLPDALRVPEGIRIAPPALPRFERRILHETACAIASRSGLPLYRRILGIVDPEGVLSAILPGLLRFYSCIKVVSDALPLYTEESERMMRELGAPVLVGCEPDMLEDCMLLLVTDATALPAAPRVPVLCIRGFPGGAPCITAPEITPPAEIAAACPPGISPHLFAGALYEFSGVMEMDFTATAMLCDYRRANLPEAVGLVLESLKLRFQ